MQWLKGGGVQLASKVAQELAPLKEYWTDPSLSADEKFLRDYILNRNYLEPDQDKFVGWMGLSDGWVYWIMGGLMGGLTGGWWMAIV